MIKYYVLHFLILIVFSMNQDATAEIEGKENREKAAKEAAEALKRKPINEQPEKISDEVVKEPVIKKKLGKLKKYYQLKMNLKRLH